MERTQRKIEKPATSVELYSEEIKGRVSLDIENNLGIDISNITVESLTPDDLDFVFIELFGEVRRKLQESERGKEAKALLNLHKTNPEKALVKLRELAKSLDIKEKGELPGFIYTVGDKIIYSVFDSSRSIDLATRYARKEQQNLSFINESEAIEYLKYLAEKYLYHEVGHIVYAKIPLPIKAEWLSYIIEREDVLKRVREVQSDNINDAMPIPTQANEAFADIFVEIASHKKFSNRLGDFVEEREEVEKILESLGFSNKK